MSKELWEEIQRMNKKRTCWNCKFCDGEGLKVR